MPFQTAREASKSIADGESCAEDVKDLKANIDDLNRGIAEKDTIIGRHLNTISRKDTIILARDSTISVQQIIIGSQDDEIKKRKKKTAFAWGVAILVGILAILL